jgi:hypothetical protein
MRKSGIFLQADAQAPIIEDLCNLQNQKALIVDVKSYNYKEAMYF